MSIATLPQDKDGAMPANDIYSYHQMRRNRAHISSRQLMRILATYEKVHAIWAHACGHDTHCQQKLNMINSVSYTASCRTCNIVTAACATISL